MAFGYEEELKAEIARLHGVIEEQTDRAEWNYECATRCEEKVIQRDAEIARLRLTDAEREAVEVFATMSWTFAAWSKVEQHAATLRGLLERLGGGK